MKNITRFSLLITVVLIAATVGFGQTALNQTIVSSAVNDNTSNKIAVASVTGAVANTTMIYIDNEASDITAVDSTNKILTVRRGTRSTTAAPHNANTIAYIDVFANFQATDPVKPNALNSPKCARTASATFNTGTAGLAAVQPVTPWINIANGNIWDCDSGTSSWRLVNLVRGPGSFAFHTVSDAAYTALLADTYIDYTYMSAARTLTLPPVTGIFGKVMIVKTDNTNGQTLTIIGSASQGVTTAAVGGSTTIVGQNTLRFMSVGGSWVTW